MKRLAVIAFALGLAALLVAAMLDLPASAIDLPAQVAANMADSGVEHTVTAVLLNFRGYDTLLEVGVLLLALINVLAIAGRSTAVAAPVGEPMFAALARLAVPLMLLVAVYLLWAGAFRPGGAFQAGAVLAGAGVLLHLAGLTPGWASPATALRSILAGGLLVFIAVATGLSFTGALLEYPPALAGALILLIESALTLSLAAMLAGLFLFPVESTMKTDTALNPDYPLDRQVPSFTDQVMLSEAPSIRRPVLRGPRLPLVGHFARNSSPGCSIRAAAVARKLPRPWAARLPAS